MGREHSNRHFAAELSALRLRLIEMGGIVEMMICNATTALADRACHLAERAIEADREINRLELEIDQRCFALLARHQPTACDLRLTTAALKTVTDLERIGDHCVSIAREALALNKEAPLGVYQEIRVVAEAAGSLVKEALDAFVTGNCDLASEVVRRVEKIRGISTELQQELIQIMQQHPGNVPRAVRLDSVTRYLERIADHATNIAEMVIFMVNGNDVRHPETGDDVARLAVKERTLLSSVTFAQKKRKKHFVVRSRPQSRSRLAR